MPASKVCSTPGCGHITSGGRCQACKRSGDRARGTARERGYGTRHEKKFRTAVLKRDPVCVLCEQAPSTEADHYPTSRADLKRQGKDPDDPQYGRGLCKPCHGSETAQHQPGGWHRDQSDTD